MDEFEKIKERLKKEGIEVVSITPEGGEYKAKIRFCTPAGELIEDEILFVGTDADFVRGFEFYAANYDVDEHVAARMSHRGSNGVPATARALVEDAEGVSRISTIAFSAGGSRFPAAPSPGTRQHPPALKQTADRNGADPPGIRSPRPWE